MNSAQLNIPKVALGIGLRMVRSSVKSRAGFDINALEPISNVDKCFVPALFGCAEEDTFILPKHAEQIHDAYAGDKNIVKFAGDHNTHRPDFFLDSCIIFFRNTMIHDGSSFQGSAHHSVNLGASEFRMPSPLASQHGMFQPLSQDGQADFLAIRQAQTTEQEQFDDDAYENMLQHALLLSMNEASQQQRHSSQG